MTVKINAKKVSFHELLNDERLSSYIAYDTLNVDFDVLYDFLSDMRRNGEADLNKVNFYVSVKISLFSEQKDRDTKLKAAQYIKTEVERIIKNELEDLLLLEDARKNTKMASRIILRKDFKKDKNTLDFVRNFYEEIEGMTLDQFYCRFVKEHKNYTEDDKFLIPDYDFKPKTIYFTENNTKINKGVIFPTETHVYGFKDPNGYSNINFYYSLKVENEKESSPIIVLLEDGDFQFKSRIAFEKFYNEKEDALKIVECELKKLWRKFKKTKKNAGF